MKWQTIILGIAIVLLFGLVSPAPAQVEKVEIRVDGLACPFCAYGLEKKLKKIEGAGKIKINVDKGIALLENKQGKSIEVEKIESIVQDAGFTPREIALTVVGRLGEVSGAPVLLISNTDEEFILRENEQLKKLRLMAKEPATRFRVRGTIKHETPEEHHAHPYTLTIEKFEVVQ